MNSSTLGVRLASALLALVCLAQFARVFSKLEVVIGGHPIPLWVSVVAGIVTGTLSIWLWRISKR
jgi:hypothetical protein